MADLSRFDMPLVQLLMAEFASNPSHQLGTSGQMRQLFLEGYSLTCHTKYAGPAQGVADLPALASVLRAHKPARELLAVRLNAAKHFTAQSFSGSHRLGGIVVHPGESFMSLRQRIFEEQRRSGATCNELAGGSDASLSLRPSKIKGKFTLEWRHAAHIHRHHSNKGGVLSYANAAETAISGALIYLRSVERRDLPPPQSRTVATMHDQRMDWCQRHLGCRELREARCPISVIYDDASKRGISYLGSAMIGTRLDGTRYHDVLRVSRLRKDVETDKTKSGLNGARALMAGLEGFTGCLLLTLLWQLYVIMCDTTPSNTGTKIITGEGGSASHLRARIEEKTRVEAGTQGHILIEQRDCLSHAGHNECEAAMTALGHCDSDRSYLSHKQDIDESKGSKTRIWSKNLLDELTQYVSERPELIRFIEVEEKIGKTLRKPPGGVVTRWGFYGRSAQWFRFETGRWS
jgi:hypothetical protein